MFKLCGRCCLTKSIEKFYLRKTGERAGQYYEKCKLCMKSRGVKYYHANRDRQLQLALVRSARSRKLKREFIRRVKDKPCVDCGLKYPFYVMDLDHRDYKNKINNVSTMMTKNWSMQKIEAEVKKCDIVCANCHRMRTFKRFAEIAKVVTAFA